MKQIKILLLFSLLLCLVLTFSACVHSEDGDGTGTGTETADPCANGHAWGEWTQTRAPTCLNKGAERLSCRICDHYKVRSVPALGHDLIADANFYICNRCDYQHATSNQLVYNVIDETEGLCEIDGIGNCTDTKLYIPAQIDGYRVVSIDDYAFYYCDQLESVQIAGNIQLTRIGSSAFKGCSSLASITIPNSVTSIEESAFAECVALESITIPSSVTSMGERTFSGCSKLESVLFEENSQLTSIESSVFLSCKNLKFLTIPSGVTSLQSSAFSGCTSLVQVENGISYVDKWVIDCDESITRVNLRGNIVGIGDYAFGYCNKIASITLPNSVTVIGNSAFQYCSNLESITIPNSLIHIGNAAFQYCSHLESITIPSSVTGIGKNAFYYCTSLVHAYFESQTGWLVNRDADATGGIVVDVSDRETSARMLTDTYEYYYWKHA